MNQETSSSQQDSPVTDTEHTGQDQQNIQTDNAQK